MNATCSMTAILIARRDERSDIGGRACLAGRAFER
jgi:hypothetical protein